MKHKFKLLGLGSLLLLGLYGMNSCVGLPDGIEPVKQFEKDRYLGKWYEIARLDHKFERGLSQVTAEYSMREDGGLKVLNRGYNESKSEWSDAEGKAYFVGATDVAHLKVSFFGPFYGSYAVFELDKEDYQYAYITSYNKDFLWFLSRTPIVSAKEKKRFLTTVTELGFDVDALIFVDHKEKGK
jgi:apolipoprotein D and lipocalin family protein